jgi:hypothetical protein
MYLAKADMHPGTHAMSGGFKSGFICEGSLRVTWAVVQGCHLRALIATVNDTSNAITVLEAATGEKLNKTEPTPVCENLCMTASQVDRRAVATGHADGMVRVRDPQSGNPIDEWRAPSTVRQVLIDATALRVMALCGDGAVHDWSFHGDAESRRARIARLRRVLRMSTPGHSTSNGLWFDCRWTGSRLLGLVGERCRCVERDNGKFGLTV